MVWILFGAVAVNMILGAIVWASIDDKDHRLYRWYADCPHKIAWIAQPLVLMAWPVGLWLWSKQRKNPQR